MNIVFSNGPAFVCSCSCAVLRTARTALCSMWRLQCSFQTAGWNTRISDRSDFSVANGFRLKQGLNVQGLEATHERILHALRNSPSSLSQDLDDSWRATKHLPLRIQLENTRILSDRMSNWPNKKEPCQLHQSSRKQRALLYHVLQTVAI